MTNKINVEPTAQIMDRIADDLNYYSKKFESLASIMRDTKDMSYASEGISTIQNMFMNIRLDLLVVRPIREYQRYLEENNNQEE